MPNLRSSVVPKMQEALSSVLNVATGGTRSSVTVSVAGRTDGAGAEGAISRNLGGAKSKTGTGRGARQATGVSQTAGRLNNSQSTRIGGTRVNGKGLDGNRGAGGTADVAGTAPPEQQQQRGGRPDTSEEAGTVAAAAPRQQQGAAAAAAAPRQQQGAAATTAGATGTTAAAVAAGLHRGGGACSNYDGGWGGRPRGRECTIARY